MRPATFWKIIVVVTLGLFLIVNFIWPDDAFRTRTIDGDGRGYYDYLPTLFIYHTVDFKQAFNYEKANQPPGYLGHNFHEVNGIYINKFTVGTALMILPFFLIAHVLSPLFGLPADGYSLLYQYETALAALFWLWAGLFFLWKLLRSESIPDSIAFWLILFLGLGTNLLYYALVDVAFSHVYSFAAISAFLFFVRRLFMKFTVSRLAAAAFLFGWIVLIRPVNGLIIAAVPFMASNSDVLRLRLIELFGSLRNAGLAIGMFLLALLPQLLINYLQTGHPVIYGYKGEGFCFFYPHFIDFLLSYRKGWFVYTPLMLMVIPAWLALYKRSVYRFVAFGVFMFLLIIVFSSWWNWYYGDGFGMRPMVDFYALFALIIALWLKVLKPSAQKGVLILSLLLAGLNMVQTYQYFKGIIHVDSMTREAYRYLFLKTSDGYRNVVAPADEYYYGKLSEKPLLDSENNFEGKVAGWSVGGSLITNPGKPADHCLKMDSITEFSSSFQFDVDKPMVNKKLYLILRCRFYEPSENAALKGLFVVDIRDKNNELKFYKAFPVKKLPDGEAMKWTDSHIGILLPVLNRGDLVKSYIWNKEKQTFFIDNMEVSLYEIH